MNQNIDAADVLRYLPFADDFVLTCHDIFGSSILPVNDVHPCSKSSGGDQEDAMKSFCTVGLIIERAARCCYPVPPPPMPRRYWAVS